MFWPGTIKKAGLVGIVRRYRRLTAWFYPQLNNSKLMSASSDVDFIRWFRSAAPYINAHRNRVFVVQFDGELVSSSNFTGFIHDLVLLDALGIRLILVHGARPQIDEQLLRAGAELKFAEGKRVTAPQYMQPVKAAIGLARFEVESRLSMGLINSPMHGAKIRVASGNFVTARPLGIRDGQDFGYSGEVRRVDAPALTACGDNGQIVLLSPIGYSPTGEMFNLSSEEVATAVALAVGADKLVMVGHDNSRAVDLGRELSLDAATRRLIEFHQTSTEPTTDAVRQLAAAVHACRNGVRRAHILDGANDGALLQELFTRDGVGTMVSADAYDETRVAGVDDVAGIIQLIKPLEESGVLLRRSRDKLENEINQFTVMERDGTIIACAAMYEFPGSDAVELGCLAVHPSYRNGERGDALLAEVESRALSAGAKQLFVLTTRTEQWFAERGFSVVGTNALPVERQALYNYQRSSKVLIKSL